ncbi:hypothetical protein H112_03137 [Trichophyton rubrum D6]|uniref:Uncharacterized protein n=2 Tax=Trichophyton TaxID=5550 RepID=A0A022W6Y9_TRIRU|nr:hypothetical protein H100_03142 [Trichophyton rubrum MR850]EZF43427.1 hypothetical protein H102_03136 [Trichophyton rubrum CBS 100081]EZF54069.1 hypothetical protein H103_03150 [Trichophyton rubrum CBS 288.86]EZF64671.1 hypothetical protein H104_03132 [Trichophyton rubrum CBS 289.86]EZF75252.1 hypothetical protein H105_03155 [Trichophyton soudanense CBS 452.61]EZF85974.1 hypothetical protein H110_03143 [Trichophyton rubrum MR1448]EZF96756.1 hypothetical protein H113_03152 [Trichophyton rub
MANDSLTRPSRRSILQRSKSSGRQGLICISIDIDEVESRPTHPAEEKFSSLFISTAGQPLYRTIDDDDDDGQRQDDNQLRRID